MIPIWPVDIVNIIVLKRLILIVTVTGTNTVCRNKLKLYYIKTRNIKIMYSIMAAILISPCCSHIFINDRQLYIFL